MGKSANRVSKFLNTSALSRPAMLLGAASVLFGAGSAQALDPGALPQDPTVTGGKSTFSQTGNTLNVNQSTNRTVIDWRSFDIGSKAQTNFNQPNSGSIAVNRVNGSANASQIEGGLHANGQVWILNPNGVFFGKSARVDAAGIVATTANIDDKAFMSGSNKLQMTGADHGSVVNQGNISVGKAGLAAFVAPSVRNSGTVNATVGKVALAAGTTYTLDLAGDHLVELGLGSVNAVVDQSGKIVNPGGTIALTAKAASQVVNSVVNVSGVVSAASATNDGGTIVLGGDNITTTSTAQLSADAGKTGNGGSISMIANNQGNYDGSFSAKGGSQGGNGGKIETSGKNVHIASNAQIDASAYNGIAGTWLLDPINVTISTGTGGNTTDATVTTGKIQDVLASGNSVDITTSESDNGDLGDITLAGTITANSANHASLTLEGRHLFATSGSVINITGGALTLDVNKVSNTLTPGSSWITDAYKMIGAVDGGTTINLGAGTYTLANEFDITKQVSLVGAGVGSTTITSNSTGYGINVTADHVKLSSFTFNAPTAVSGSTYGIKVQPDTNTPSDRLLDFNIDHVMINGGWRTALDLNGVVGSTIDHVSISGVQHGNAIALTDSANVTITNTQTRNDLWGGLALYQHNNFYNQQINNISVNGTNTFNEKIPVYIEDQSDGISDPTNGPDVVGGSGLNVGTLNIAGFGYAVRSPGNSTDVYTWLQPTPQNAIDFATSSTLGNGNVNLATAVVQGWTGSAVNNTFTVGTSSGGTAMSIQNAVNVASDGAIVNIGDGTYTGQVIVDNKNLTLSGDGAGDTIIASPNTLTAYTPTGSTSAKSAIVSIQHGADVTIEGLTVDGLGKGDGSSSFDGIGVFNASADIENVDVTRVRDGGVSGTLSGAQHGVGVEVFNGDGVARSVSLLDSSIEDFQKNATTFSGGNLTADIEGNTITGSGPVAAGGPAQNGIQLSGKTGVGNGLVTGTIANNIVTGIDYSPATASAVGILLINAPNVTVTGNTVTGGAQNDGSVGVYAINSSGLVMANNSITNTGYGVVLYTGTTGASITGGTISDNIFGVQTDTSSGVTVSGVSFSNNTYHFQGSSSDAAHALANNTFDASVINASAGDVIYGKLQTAIDNEAAGSTLDLNGVFKEQVSLDKNMTLVGSGEGTTTIEAPDTLVNSFNTQVGFATNTNVKAIVAVTGGASVKIEDLTVDGLDKGDVNDYFMGIGADDSTLTVSGVHITGLTNNPLGGAQSGVGIGVFNEDGVARTATITSSTIDDFQKNGIALQGGNLTVDVEDNTVTGVGATTAIAQNGIELFGLDGVGDATVSGTIADNIVSGLDYTGGNNSATGILLWNAPGVVVTGNTVTGGGLNDGSNGIYAISSNSASFTNNTITNAGYGIGLYGSSGATITGGTISHSLVGVEADSTSTGLSASGVTFSNNTDHFEGSDSEAADLFANNSFDKAVYATGSGEVGTDLQAAIDNASAGGTISATGSFNEDVTDSTQLAFNFDNTTVDSFMLNAGGAGSTLSGELTATGAITENAAASLNGTFNAASIALNGAATLTGDTTLNATNVTVASVTGGGNDLTIDGATSLGNVAGVGALAVDGAATLTGTSYAADSISLGATTLSGDTTLDANTVTVASVTGGGNDLTIDGATLLGNVAGAGALAVDGAATLTGTSYAAGSMDFGGAITLTGNTTLDTSGDNGAVVLASVDGTTAGGQSLTVTAGTGTVTTGNLGATTRLGSVTDTSNTVLTGSTYDANSFAFGTVTLTAATTTLNTTQSSSAAGDITFSGNILGTSNGAQSLVLIAGSGTGAASANGNITLQNAGTSTTELNNLTVSGNNFTALTVDLAGNFSSQLTGNQVFAADTLNAGGNVTSNVGGNATGHIDADGDVNVNAAGNVSGNISGDNVNLNANTVTNSTITGSSSVGVTAGNVNTTTINAPDVTATVTGNFDADVTASNNANIQAKTIEGSYSGGTITLVASKSVDANVNADTLNVSSPTGSVDGTWTTISTDNSGVLDINGEQKLGDDGINPNQIIVENFALPAGSIVTASGEIILPQGMVIGLLSPGGGKPKVILVHSVHQLGSLLAAGYSAIVIDLSTREKDKPVKLASN